MGGWVDGVYVCVCVCMCVGGGNEGIGNEGGGNEGCRGGCEGRGDRNGGGEDSEDGEDNANQMPTDVPVTNNRQHMIRILQKDTIFFLRGGGIRDTGIRDTGIIFAIYYIYYNKVFYLTCFLFLLWCFFNCDF